MWLGQLQLQKKTTMVGRFVVAHVGQECSNLVVKVQHIYKPNLKMIVLNHHLTGYSIMISSRRDAFGEFLKYVACSASGITVMSGRSTTSSSGRV